MTLADRARSGKEIITAWSAIPDPMVVEAMLRAGYDTVTLDMQHGLHDLASIVAGINAAKLCGKDAIVRIPVGAFHMASRALDIGAAGVIAPMVNTQEDAKAFAASMKYPPLGERSWGPARAMTLNGISSNQDYLGAANHSTLAIVMIETREALENLDAILAVDGIDGVFVGPSDLSVTFSKGAEIEPFNAETMPAIEDIVQRAQAKGKIACIFTLLPSELKAARKIGYTVFALNMDGGLLATSAAHYLAEAKG